MQAQRRSLPFSGETTYLHPTGLQSPIVREYTSRSRERESFRVTKIGGVIYYRRKQASLLCHFETSSSFERYVKIYIYFLL